MIVHLTEQEQKLTDELHQAEQRLNGVNKELLSVEDKLRGLREQSQSAKLLDEISQCLDQLCELQPLEGIDPFLGQAGDAEARKARYHSISQRITSQVGSFQSVLQEYEAEYSKLQQRVNEEQKNIRLLQKQLEEARPTIRKQTITLKDDQGHETTFTITFRTDSVMPWGDDGPDENRFKRIRNAITILLILVSLVMPWIPVPELEQDEMAEIPPRLAQLIQKKEPPPPPPPVKQQKVEEKKEDKRELKPRKKAPDVKNEAEKKARDVASRSGLLAFSDAFSDLMNNEAEEKLGKQAQVTSGGETAIRTERSLVTSSATAGSGGINTASLSRDTGGVGLGGKGGSARVTGVIGGADYGDSDRPLSDSYKGSRTDEEIQLVFDRNKSILYSIYQRELRKDPTLQGKIVLRLTIEPSGRVSSCSVDSSDLGHPQLEKKIAGRVKLFNFGAKDVDAITISFPIDFLPA